AAVVLAFASDCWAACNLLVRPAFWSAVRLSPATWAMRLLISAAGSMTVPPEPFVVLPTELAMSVTVPHLATAPHLLLLMVTLLSRLDKPAPTGAALPEIVLEVIVTAVGSTYTPPPNVSALLAVTVVPSIVNDPPKTPE